MLRDRHTNSAANTELRARFRAKGIDYRVVKNTLVEKALEGTPLATDEKFLGFLKGPTAIAWSYEDPSSAAKIIKEFRKENEPNEKLTVKCGVLENQFMPGANVETVLATLPGKNEVRAMLLAQLNAPAQKLLMQLMAPGQNLAFALDARKRQLENNG